MTSRVSHGEFAEAIANLEQGKLRPDALITGTLPASRTQEGFERLDADPANNLKILLDFSTDQ